MTVMKFFEDTPPAERLFIGALLVFFFGTISGVVVALVTTALLGSPPMALQVIALIALVVDLLAIMIGLGWMMVENYD